MFRRILIANRGEIALRVLRTAREMGVEVAAVYSHFDRAALHARLANVAVPLGGSTPAESYLAIDKLLDAARKSGSEAVHPGYGFLSENEDFAQAVLDAGLAWIGPPPEAIRAMGDKIESRRLMQAAGVPVVPGLVEALADPAQAAREAERIGYPIALKASAGGGGKGIRVVREPAQMEGAFRGAAAEAEKAFGDGRMYLERYLDRPRHVEVRVSSSASWLRSTLALRLSARSKALFNASSRPNNRVRSAVTVRDSGVMLTIGFPRVVSSGPGDRPPVSADIRIRTCAAAARRDHPVADAASAQAPASVAVSDR
jgi:hypothetical protein